MMKKEDINKKNSATWCRVNEDGNATGWRKRFTELFGGEFVKNIAVWEWKEDLPEPEPEPEVKVIKPAVKSWVVPKPNGKKDVITNLSKYCKEHKLDDSAIYRVLNGERNHHKGYRIQRGD